MAGYNHDVVQNPQPPQDFESEGPTVKVTLLDLSEYNKGREKVETNIQEMGSVTIKGFTLTLQFVSAGENYGKTFTVNTQIFYDKPGVVNTIYVWPFMNCCLKIQFKIDSEYIRARNKLCFIRDHVQNTAVPASFSSTSESGAQSGRSAEGTNEGSYNTAFSCSWEINMEAEDNGDDVEHEEISEDGEGEEIQGG